MINNMSMIYKMCGPGTCVEKGRTMISFLGVMTVFFVCISNAMDYWEAPLVVEEWAVRQMLLMNHSKGYGDVPNDESLKKWVTNIRDVVLFRKVNNPKETSLHRHKLDRFLNDNYYNSTTRWKQLPMIIWRPLNTQGENKEPVYCSRYDQTTGLVTVTPVEY